MKKNTAIIVFIVIIVVLAGIGIFMYNKNKNNKNENSNANYEANKTSTASNENNTTNSSNNVNNNINITKNATGNPITSEEEIATFSTKILTKDSNRQHNIQLTCSTLNDTIVENDSTFSFCNTVGQATTQKGYKEADIFDANGKKKKGLGGGNCQISTTLYNAVLKVPSLTVTERHEHSNYVPYIQDGKDAAVAYGSYDFKFKNNSGNSIKIKAEPTENEITIRLLKLS